MIYNPAMLGRILKNKRILFQADISHKLLTSVFVLLLHFIIFLLYILYIRIDNSPDFWDEWAIQLTILVTISAILFTCAFLFRGRSSRISLLLLQISIFLICVYGEAAFPIPLLLWGSAIIFEGYLFLDWKSALWFSLCVALLTIFFPRANTLWDVEIYNRHMVDRIASGTYFAVIVYLSAAYNRTREQAQTERVSKERLRESLIRLTKANIGFQDYADLAEQKGVEEERHRITREIHDTIGYTLTNVIMMTKATEELIGIDHELLKNLLNDARAQCQDALSETRHTLRTLWRIKTPEVAFPNHVLKTIRTFEMATGINVILEFQNLPDNISHEICEILHRALQEGLTNAFRHGQATRMSVLFWYDGVGVSILITDNGVGNPKILENIGIGGMRERFEPKGGTVKVRSLKEGGFEVRAWVPLKEHQSATV
jgi:signal transduction histidine kinase